MESAKIRIVTVVSSPFEENTYIIHPEVGGECIVVDPGLEPDEVIRQLDDLGLTPRAFLNTHGHSDHIGGNAALTTRWPECPLVIGVGDAPMLTDARRNLSADFGIPIVSPAADVTLEDGQVYEVAGLRFEARAVPGHSPGHMVYVVQGQTPPVVLVGDVIFAGSIGRTDFPGGSLQTLLDGIRRKLYTLPNDTVLLPGHGPATTVGQEKKTNPFVRASG